MDRPSGRTETAPDVGAGREPTRAQRMLPGGRGLLTTEELTDLQETLHEMTVGHARTGLRRRRPGGIGR
jgi:hypothetical protein